MTKYLHTMIRVSDPDATVNFFKLIGLEEVLRFDEEKTDKLTPCQEIRENGFLQLSGKG